MTPRSTKRQTPSKRPHLDPSPILSASPNGRALQRSPDQQTAPLLKNLPSWLSWSEVKIKLRNLPREVTPLDVFQLFKRIGNPTYIQIFEIRAGETSATAIITFKPPPCSNSWLYSGVVSHDRNGSPHQVVCSIELPKDHRSATNRDGPKEIAMNIAQVDFGVLKDESTMLVLHTVVASRHAPMTFAVALPERRIELRFSLEVGNGVQHTLRFRVPFSQISSVYQVDEGNSRRFLYIPMSGPPEVARRADDVESTFDPKDRIWNDRLAWYRQTDIGTSTGPRDAVTKLQNHDSVIDIGRWLQLRLLIPDGTAATSVYKDILQVLWDHNVKAHTQTPFSAMHHPRDSLWDCLKQAAVANGSGEPSSILFDMHFETVSAPMSFPVRYQLEVCLSQGMLHECNLDGKFIEALGEIDQDKAVRLLEKVAQMEKRFYRPEEIFHMQEELSSRHKKVPKYCTMVRSAVVTPTTIHLATPILETSNRVVRQYRHVEDRFLRVRFTDEKYMGRMRAGDNVYCNELLTRVYRTMKNGIDVGDRHYDFLAFGNSQFREHGCYFFASTSSVTADSIRSWMGNFSNIRVIAKHASRIGQCFSTTRALTSSGVKLLRIPDIERNGYNFTDGVGKISIFLAQMIAEEFGIPDAIANYPSVFQFRLAGCKGVLTVDPSLKGRDVHIRPSQEKFPALHEGLEICRISQYSTAYLNRQIILVLSALGVEDSVFLRKMRGMLTDFQVAMVNENKAVTLLQRNIDFNQTTVTLASMIFDGFMDTKEPFLMSCLALWRSWSIKYLKEKAKISVEDGAFVLGCVDETASLKGNLNDKIKPGSKAMVDIASLPEIFLQISDPVSRDYKVIQGICTIARNPSLHPGDVRVVHAVECAKLRHLKNCVVFPQTGDRDLPNMCSGGDLDGDDYLVMWDSELQPEEWNYPAMDYSAPPAVESDGPVTVDQITSFFVTYMKNDNLARIAVAHRCWADLEEDGVKSNKCDRLAHLHSRAVDYCKTGVPAVMEKDLYYKRRPHWAAGPETPHHKTYHSNKILGRLFDEVQAVPFRPAWEMPFDNRILDAYEITEDMLRDAREVKQHYDESVSRVMAQHGIETEFEVWTAFVLQHNEESNDYKFAESLGETARALKEQYQDMCYVKAGTTAKDRDFEKLGPFIAAMYKVTADEVAHAVHECKQTKFVGGQDRPVRIMDVGCMPFMSFPWIFTRELGLIATKKACVVGKALQAPLVSTGTVTQRRAFRSPGDDFKPKPLEIINLDNNTIHSDGSGTSDADVRVPACASTSNSDSGDVQSHSAAVEILAASPSSRQANTEEKEDDSGDGGVDSGREENGKDCIEAELARMHSVNMLSPIHGAVIDTEADKDTDDETSVEDGESVIIAIEDETPSALDKLVAMVGL